MTPLPTRGFGEDGLLATGGVGSGPQSGEVRISGTVAFVSDEAEFSALGLVEAAGEVVGVVAIESKAASLDVAGTVRAASSGGSGGPYIPDYRRQYEKKPKKKPKPQVVPGYVAVESAPSEVAASGEVVPVVAGAVAVESAPAAVAASGDLEVGGAVVVIGSAAEIAAAGAHIDRRTRLVQLFEVDPDAALAQMIRWQRDAA